MSPFLQLDADTATQNLQNAALVAMACSTCTTTAHAEARLQGWCCAASQQGKSPVMPSFLQLEVDIQI